MDGLVLARAGGSVFRASRATNLVVELRDPLALGDAERRALLERCRHANMAIYACTGTADDPSIPLRIASRLGLRALLSAQDGEMDGLARVPWHTAGHANPAGLPVRASVIHCMSAGEGGELSLLDPELVWLRLRDEGESFVEVLSRGDAFSIPHRRGEGHAVFAFDAGGNLRMRFSEDRDAQRWKCDALVAEAAARLRRLLDREASGIARTRLAAGMGVISNNVLVTRAMLHDARTRMVRATYRERVPG